MASKSHLFRRALALLPALLAACASGPPSRPGTDGPPPNPPPNLARVPDAEPRIEPLRVGGPNKPYEIFGQRYVPMTTDAPLSESGGASWYGRKFHGLPTASGEVYDMYAMTAAHKTMPLPSYAIVRNPANGREIVVRVNDRGPFAAGRVIDLSYVAALKLGVLNGVAPVQVRRLTFDDIRSGRWKAAQVPSPDAIALLMQQLGGDGPFALP
ncbi:MAG: septal ring lytic transglycosylase RlpA family protein [Rubrivivax sp.]|nr:septal ring lytic transglycosylase RlpA family protein [Rubrivivax sp.]